jgi:hypothetical protein
MDDEFDVTPKKESARIIGAVSTGVTNKVATGLGISIREAFGRRGKHIKIKGMRFIPSTKVDLGKGSFQVMANTVVEIAGVNGAPVRPQAFDSVVTIARQPHSGQILESVKFPVLD